MPSTEQYLSQTAAAALISPYQPISRDTAQRLHDVLGGPRDSSGRRIWTTVLCAQARELYRVRRALPVADNDNLTASSTVGEPKA